MIVNPAAGRGVARATLPLVRSAFAARGIDNVYESTAPGDEENLAARAIRDGVQTIVAVGGDGTCGRIANVILNSGTACRFAVVPTGTGNDFAKTLGMARLEPEQIADLVVREASKQIDVGAAAGFFFLNSCGFGFDAAVLEASNRVRFLRGYAVYIYSTLAQLFTYRGADVSAKWDSRSERKPMLMAIVSNGRYLGGAFRIAPRASVTDGKLDVCMFGDVSLWRRPSLFRAAIRGTHTDIPSVSAVQTREITFTFAEPPAMEIDGELRRATSRTVRVECIPRALSVIAAPGAIS